jgi:beta-glucosidase
LTDKELGFFDNEGNYLVESGAFKIRIGGSSDTGLESVFELQ